MPSGSLPTIPQEGAVSLAVQRKSSLLDLLVRLCSAGWTGRLVAVRREESVGWVVVYKGRIAWAVCQNQPETLGTFLWRLGRITRSQYREINNLYMEHKGKRKLGSLLEDAGYVKRPVLRRCLVLHTRRALGCLLSEDGTRPRKEKLNLSLDDADLFDLEEVMPHLRFHPALGPNPATPSSARARKPPRDHPLRAFAEIPGYLASAVVSAEGEVIVADTPEEGVDPSLLGVLLVSVLESSSRVVAPTSLGVINFLLIDCDRGTLVARWLDDDRRHLAAVLLSSEGNLGLAKYKVNESVPSIYDWLDDHGKLRSPCEE
jgi:predicted regulator of Ras-like GTPase activity (Roadblock/LC7/MglB family)